MATGKADKPTSKITVRLDPQLLRRLRVHCAKQGLKVQWAVEAAVKEWLKKTT